MTINPTPENVQRIREHIAERSRVVVELRVLHAYLSEQADEQWRRILCVESEIRTVESALAEAGIALEESR